jgi:inner membrane protein
MDTLTHALSGALVARLLATAHEDTLGAAAPLSGPATSGRFSAPWDGHAGGPRLWQFVLTGFIAGAFPDIDSLAQLAGDVAYLRHHRGITHSLLALPLWAALLACLMASVFAATRAQRGGWKSLYLVCASALALHIAGDWITQFGTMLLQPLSDARFGLGAMFIIDLSFTGILLGALLLAAVFAKRRWPAALGLLAASAWVCLAWVGQQEAMDVGRAHAKAQGMTATNVSVMPRPASPFNWTVTVFDGRTYHLAHVNTRRSEPLTAGPDANFIRRFSAPYQPVTLARWEQVPRFGAEGTPAWVQEAWQHEAWAFYRWFAQTPALISAAAEPLAGGGTQRCAWFRDLRFEFPGRGESPFRYGICLLPGGQAEVYRLEGGQRRPV